MFRGFESKSGIAIFNRNLKNTEENEIVEVAVNYWIEKIRSCGINQISYEMGNGMINFSDKELLKLKKVFKSYISKYFPVEDTYMMLWTSNGEFFNQIGTDNYLKEIMRIADMPLVGLPSDVCMWIYPDKIELETNHEQSLLFDKSLSKIK